MSGWLLSEQKEEKIDDFVEELETMGFLGEWGFG